MLVQCTKIRGSVGTGAARQWELVRARVYRQQSRRCSRHDSTNSLQPSKFGEYCINRSHPFPACAISRRTRTTLPPYWRCPKVDTCRDLSQPAALEPLRYPKMIRISVHCSASVEKFCTCVETEWREATLRRARYKRVRLYGCFACGCHPMRLQWRYDFLRACWSVRRSRRSMRKTTLAPARAQ